MLAHGLGVHGLQAVPVLGLLLGAARSTSLRARTLLHIGGLGWLTACLAAHAQALTGNPSIELSPFPLLTLASLLTFALTTLSALRHWQQRPIHQSADINEHALAPSRH